MLGVKVGRKASRGVAVNAASIVAAGMALSLGMTASASAASVTSVSGSAFGASVDVQTLGLVHVQVGPTPTVTLPSTGSASPITQTLATLNVPGLLSLGVMNESTVGTPSGGTTHSSSDTAAASIPLVLTADAIHSTCNASTSGATGTTTLANVKVAGVSVVANPAPGFTVGVPGVATVTFNEQVQTGTASSPGITVNAVHVRLLAGLGGLGTGDIIIAQSHCDVTGGTQTPVGALGGILLTGVVGVAFTGYQFRRRRNRSASAVSAV
jgi:hypothetical protein